MLKSDVMRAKTKEDFDRILHCFMGTIDCGVGFARLRAMIHDMDIRAEMGDDRAEAIIDVMRRFSRFVQVVTEPKRTDSSDSRASG